MPFRSARARLVQYRACAAPRAAATAAALAAALAAACGGGADRPVTAPAPRLTELWLEVDAKWPARAVADSMERGEQRVVRAHGRLDDGRVVRVDSARWALSDTTVLRGDPAPRAASLTVQGVGEGGAGVAASAAGLRAEVRYTVLRPVARMLLVQAPGGEALTAPDSVIVGTPRRYRAAVTSGHVTITDRAVTWTSSDPTVATVDADGTLTGHAFGTVTLRAASDDVAGSAAVVVRPPLAARIAFVTVPDTVRVRRTDSVRVVLYDSAGAPIAVRARITLDPSAAGSGSTATLVDATAGSGPGRVALVTGATPGTAQLVATGDGLTVRRTVPVVQLPQGAPNAYPAAVVAAPGTSLLLAAQAADVDGYPLPVAGTPAYASADPAVATVTAAGVVTARGAGATTVRVRTGETFVDVPVTVVGTGAFSIDIRTVDATTTLPALVSTAVSEAVQRWERTILGDLPALRFTLPAGACSRPGAPAEELDIDDVVVFVSADSLDGPGGVLAQAGPCVVRTGGATAVGRVFVDVADVATLNTSGRLASVLQHEIGHVLGIGTLWSRTSAGLVVRNGPEFRYRGVRGARVALWWGRVADDAVGGVPLGEALGPGNGHWSESVFGNELMTPIANVGTNPLSLLSVEALADLGYLTSAAGADPYGLYAGVPPGGGPTTSRAPVDGPHVGDGSATDRVLEPTYRVGRDGRLTPLP